MYQNDVGHQEDEPSRFDTPEGVKYFLGRLNRCYKPSVFRPPKIFRSSYVELAYTTFTRSRVPSELPQTPSLYKL